MNTIDGPTKLVRQDAILGGLSIGQLKVKYQTIKYKTLGRVRSINPIPIEGFSSNLAEMFTSTRGCAESMLPMCQLKVKVTIEGRISNNQILDIMLCLLCKSYTNWKIFFNLGSNVHLNMGMCRTHVTLFPA